MGRTNALGMAANVNDGLIDMERAIEWHLCFNHFPPVSNVFVPVALEAMAAAEAGDWDMEITMPNDITLPVSTIVEQLHLDSFLDPSEEW